MVDRPRRSPADEASLLHSDQATREAATLARAQSTGVADVGSGLFRLLVETVRDYAIFLLDPGGHILSWNAGAQHLKGYTTDEVLGRHFSMFYPPEDMAWDKPARELELALRDGRVEDEGWRLKKDGTRFWANVVITTLRDETGEVVGFAKVTRDLSERRAAELAIKDSEQRFRLLVETVRDYAIFMLDPTGHVMSWNAGAQRIKGYRAEEIIGQHFSTFYPPEKVAEHFPEYELEVAARTGHFEDEGWRVKKDGTQFWANVVITALRDEHGTLVGFAKVTRDLTERRAASERALEDARRLAAVEAANRTKGEFLAAMSHELRTPLNAIGGYVELLLLGLGGTVSAQQTQYLERIRGSQQHLLAIINDILNFSRIEAGQIAYTLAPVSLCDLIDRVLPMVEPQAAAKGLVIERLASTEVVALADRGKVEQILINLLSNAIKFTDAGGRVELTCRLVGDRAELGIRDTGVGIPADQTDSIFEPFVQVGRSLTNPHEGTGLGLAISRDLARAMNGDLTVQSVVGEGSHFTLQLPTA
jgi:PAS domain S-box-containing protein